MTKGALAARLGARVPLHPGAWWIWATAMAAVAMQTTNPVLLLLLGSVTLFVAAARRDGSNTSRSVAVFLRFSLLVIALRVVLQVLVGDRVPGDALFTLPHVPLPRQAAGVSLGGPVTAQSLLSSFAEGLRLADVLLAFGAANSLANPYRLLRSLPAVLFESGLVVTVALSYAPELVETIGSVRAARRLRGRPTRGLRGLRGLVVPVLEGALDRSLELAASMDARGFGRRAARPASIRRAASLATAAGMLCVLGGLYAVLASSGPPLLGGGVLAGGVALLAAGLVVGSRRSPRTRYRPAPWRASEWLVVGVAVALLGGFAASSALRESGLHPAFSVLEVPSLPGLAVLAALCGLLPAVATPPARATATSNDEVAPIAPPPRPAARGGVHAEGAR